MSGVRVVAGLLDAQTTRFERIDPLLPPAALPPEGDVLTAALPDGDRVAAVLSHSSFEPGTATTLWSALELYELHPLLGAAAGDGMDALLREWRHVLDHLAPGSDSACLLTWPSRDAEAARPLLAHGFTPLTSIAVRTVRAGTPKARAPQAGVTVRLATPADLEAVLALELAELAYSALVGAAVLRPDAEAVKRVALAGHFEQGDLIWLAERDGVVTGVAHCRLLDVTATGLTGTLVRPGRWGYVNCVSVAEGARGGGVGRELMAVAHHELHARGATGTFLYVNPPNPLASVFWARQGYRPLWTSWELRPAGAMR
ncbi:GNAT family N-acetyltransferase [Actinophytocola oryzae]|uniref:Ribosomal protein S18 acetylase RimI-like enzyme n=1 Tax=Actinophytocola oryzae TaxID=502181 RepID=A0A4R7V060_9PSEU|nr:GNAT family N-acetyltransferase [Actinophytocola oryzae]TDV42589.1 ribosomal protein S18 acetylase RimI-like enzyme [Actinophytocola oryzae]